MHGRKRLQLLVAVVVLALVGVACGGGDGKDTPSAGGKAGGSVKTYLGEPDSFTPTLGSTTSFSEVGSLVWDSLLSYNGKTAQVETNGAAESYTVSPDALKITYKLRKGANFHNGEPVTAESFVRSLTLVARKDTASEVAYHLSGIKGFTAIQEGRSTQLPGVYKGADDYELVIELEEPNAEFYVRTGHLVFSPLPKAAVNANGTLNKAFQEAPIGNGPYKVDGKWEHNVQIKVNQWDGYNGKDKGFLKDITFKIFEKTETAFLEFQAGTLDASGVTPEQYDTAEQQYGDGFIEQQTSALTYVIANTKASPTNNADFRRAVSLAINREEIVKAVFSNRRVPATSIVPPTTVGHRPNVCQYCKFDLAKAKELLTKAGGPKKIIIAFNSGAGHEEWTAAVAAQLKTNLGIESTLTGKTPFGDYLDYLKTPAFGGGLGRLGWAQDYPTPDNWLYPLLYSKSGDNKSGFNNAQFDAKITEAQKTLDATKRLQLQQESEDIALNEMPIIPMWYSKSARVYSKSKFATHPIELQTGYPDWREVSVK